MRWVLAVLAAFVLFGACGEEDLEFPGQAAPTSTAAATSTPGTQTPGSTPTPTPTETPT